jgi:ERCC4-related helicase
MPHCIAILTRRAYDRKTLIALLLIKEFAPSFDRGKQTMFLVPSVALAIQQEAVLRASLPFTVGSVHGAAVFSTEKVVALSKCNVLVATHGACLTLLQSHTFKVEQWNLLIMDECHNCTGNNPYADIMKYFYHEQTEAPNRPRVLGLTASPLINVKLNHTDSQLESHLNTLEAIMDSKIISLESLGLDEDDPDLEMARKQVDHTTISYEAMESTDFEGWPDVRNGQFKLHVTRSKELNRFQQLYLDVGPLPVKLYATHVLQRLKRNEYENERPEQFMEANRYVQDILLFVEDKLERNPTQRVSPKLAVLEELLRNEIGGNTSRSASGVVFVQQRITAAALEFYFRHRSDEIQDAIMSTMPSDAETARNVPSTGMSLSGNDQFVDAEESDGYSSVDVEIEEMLQDLNECDAKNVDDQFADADSCDDPFFTYDTTPHCVDSAKRESFPVVDCDVSPCASNVIRCRSLVRSQRSIFTLNRVPTEQEILAEAHHVQRFRRILNDFRFGKLNVLIATAVVEEGVDVQACSFVVVFDGLTCLKNYIQMKGRARADGAKFFVFRSQENGAGNFLSLENAMAAEQKVRTFLCARKHLRVSGGHCDGQGDVGHCEAASPLDEAELQAAKSGVYKARSVFRSGVHSLAVFPSLA